MSDVEESAPGLEAEADEERAFDELVGKHAKKVRDADKMEKVREAKGKKEPEPKEPEPDPEPASVSDGQEPEPDKAPEPEKKPAEDDDKAKKKVAEDAARFAAIARRERAALDVERRAKEALATVEAKNREIAEQAQKIQSVQRELAEIRRSPLKLLEWGGYKLDDAVEYTLNDQRPTVDMASREVETRVMAELRALKEQLAERDRRDQESAKRAQADAEERALQSFRRDIDGFLRTNADEYELIHAHDAQSEVFDLIQMQYEADGTLLEIDEAAKRIEAALEERGRKLLSSKKLGGYLASQTASTPTHSKQATQTREQKASPKTITNSLVSSPGGGDDDLLSMDDDTAFEVLVNRTKARRSRRA